MDAKQEFALKMLRQERKVWLGPDNKADLEECDRRIKEIEDLVAAGKPGVPRFWVNAIAGGGIRQAMNHESTDDRKCKRCGIEKIYWRHFPDCSRFKPLMW